MRKHAIVALAGAATVALLAACSSAPTATTSSAAPSTSAADSSSAAPSSSAPPASSAPAAAAFKACMVTDTGGIDDRSFNASAWKGMQDAKAALGVDVKYVESKSNNDYVPNINALIGEKCSLIVTVGFLMGDATTAAAKANPTVKFAIVDVGSDPKIPNLKGLQFNTAQSAFQAGYLSAGLSKTGVVATFGGLPIPPVTVYEDGFWEGVQYYNTKMGKQVKVLGWDEKNPKTGTMSGGFTDQAKGQQITKNFIQQGADVIFPVAGSVGLGAAKEAQTQNKMLIWVDSDGYLTAPQFKNVIVTSVVKGIDASVKEAVTEAQAGTFSNKQFVGDLANGGTLLSPYHDFDATIPADLKAAVTAIGDAIKAGTIKLTSPNQPTS